VGKYTVLHYLWRTRPVGHEDENLMIMFLMPEPDYAAVENLTIALVINLILLRLETF
jgi:hypothetical protein